MENREKQTRRENNSKNQLYNNTPPMAAQLLNQNCIKVEQAKTETSTFRLNSINYFLVRETTSC